MPSIPREPPLYITAELIEHRRSILRYARSFPPGSERNNHRQVALLFRALFNSKDWLDTHTVEGFGNKRDRDLARLDEKGASPIT